MSAIKRFAIKNLEPRFYGALWFLALVVCVAIGILLAKDANGYKDDITLLAAVLAIDVATIGWIWTGRMAILMARKTNALALLERISSPEINQIKEKVYPYIEEYDRFKRSDSATRPHMPEVEVQKLLGVYEQVSVAIIHGAVDAEMIKASQLLVFKRVYRGLFHHIERVQEQDKGYFQNFENLTCTWHPDLQRRAAALADPGGLFAPMRNADT